MIIALLPALWGLGFHRGAPVKQDFDERAACKAAVVYTILDGLDSADPQVRARALDASRYFIDPKLDDKLCELSFTDPDANAKGLAWGLVIHRPWLWGRVIRRLRSSNPDDRAQAASILHAQLRSRSLPYMVPLLRDPDSRVREAAVTGIEGSGDVLLPLLKPLLKDSCWAIRFVSVAALANNPSPKCLEVLGETLSTESSPRVRTQYAKAFGRLALFNRRFAEKEILTLVFDNDGGTVSDALYSLAVADYKKAKALAASFLHDPRGEVASESQFILRSPPERFRRYQI